MRTVFNLKRTREIIDSSFGEEDFFTTDVIRHDCGRFLSDRDTPPCSSRNAQFGKFLRRHEHLLGITLMERGVRINDDNGHRTSSARWQKRK